MIEQPIEPHELYKTPYKLTDEQRAKLNEHIEAVLDTLPFREREIIKLRYCLNDENRSYTLDEIGRIFCITRERVREIEARAMLRLQGRIKASKSFQDKIEEERADDTSLGCEGDPK